MDEKDKWQILNSLYFYENKGQGITSGVWHSLPLKT